MIDPNGDWGNGIDEAVRSEKIYRLVKEEMRLTMQANLDQRKVATSHRKPDLEEYDTWSWEWKK